MTSSNLDLAWPPPCLQCGRHTETSKMPQEHGDEQIRGEAHNAGRRRIPESQYHHEPKEAFHAAPQPCLIPPTHSGQMRHPDPADFWPNGLNEQFLRYERDSMAHHSKDFASASKYLQHNSLEEAESLEPPLPLVSDSNYTHYVRSPYSAGRMTGQCWHSINIPIKKTSEVFLYVKGFFFFQRVIIHSLHTYIIFFEHIKKMCMHVSEFAHL